jgi:hypothetical protein
MKILSVRGVFAPISYVATVTLGGSLRHRHMKQTGSDVVETGASNKSLLDALFPVYARLSGFISSGLRARTKTI